MCDSVVIAAPGQPVWIAKNSDREADEVQIVDWQPAHEHPAASEVRCTHRSIPQVPQTQGVLLSRPRWMWGCEMGVNAAGVAVANEAVFTRVPVADSGLTGMDLQRLALEAAKHLAHVEIVEEHSITKVDAPSGTAADTAVQLAGALGREPSEIPIHCSAMGAFGERRPAMPSSSRTFRRIGAIL